MLNIPLAVLWLALGSAVCVTVLHTQMLDDNDEREAHAKHRCWTGPMR